MLSSDHILIGGDGHLFYWGEKCYINSFPGLIYYLLQQWKGPPTCENLHNLKENFKSILFNIHWTFTQRQQQTKWHDIKEVVGVAAFC